MDFESELTLENRAKLNMLKKVRQDLDANLKFYRYQKFRKLGIPEEEIAQAIWEEEKLLMEQKEEITEENEEDEEGKSDSEPEDKNQEGEPQKLETVRSQSSIEEK